MLNNSIHCSYNIHLYVWLGGPFTESQDANHDFMKHLSEDPLDKDEEADDDKFVKSLFRYVVSHI